MKTLTILDGYRTRNSRNCRALVAGVKQRNAGVAWIDITDSAGNRGRATA